MLIENDRNIPDEFHLHITNINQTYSIPENPFDKIIRSTWIIIFYGLRPHLLYSVESPALIERVEAIDTN